MATDSFGLEGQVLDGQFRVEKAIGEGGFSVVYRGRHVGLDEPIAIKCLKLAPSLGAAVIDSFVRRFRDESKIQYKLSQGNLSIVRAIASGTSMAPATGALVPYMVLEWLDGMTLEADFEARHARGLTGRSLEEMVELLDSGAEAVAYAHTQGVIHRDLNPGNFFIVKPQAMPRPGEGPLSGAPERHRPRLKILDFGVAKVVSDHAMELGPRAQTMGFIRIFSPAYGAPEQFQDSLGKMGPWTDVYTFAMIALEALCDAQPYEGNNIGEYAAHALNPKVRPTPRTLGLTVSDEVEQVFVRALALKPEERFRDLGEFWGALRSVVRISREQISFAAARQTPSLALPGGEDDDDVTEVKSAGELQTLIERVSKNFGNADLKATKVADPSPLVESPDTYREDLPTAETEQDETMARPMPLPEAALARKVAPGAAKTLAFSSPSPASSPFSPSKAPETAPEDKRPISDVPSDITPMAKPPAALFRTLAFSSQPQIAVAAPAPPSNEFPAPPPVLHSEPAPSLPRNAPSAATAPPTSPVAFSPQAFPPPQAAPTAMAYSQTPPPAAASPAVDHGAHTLALSGPPGTPMMHPAPIGQGMPGPSMSGPAFGPPSGSVPGMQAPPMQGGPPMQVPPMQAGPPTQGAPGQPPAHTLVHSSGYGAASAAAGYPMPHAPHAPHAQAAPPYASSAAAPTFPISNADPPKEPTEKKGRGLVIASIVAFVFLLLGGGGLVLFLKRGDKQPKPPATATATPTALATASAPTPSADPAPEPPPAPSAPVTADPAPAAPDTAPSTSVSPPSPSAAPSASAAPKPIATGPAPTPVTPPSPSSAQPEASKFDSKAASAAANKWGVMAGSCKEKDGLGGPGTANLTFAPSGDVTSVTIDPPYAGTTEGSCIQRLLQRSKMSAYDGPPGTIRYRFSLPK